MKIYLPLVLLSVLFFFTSDVVAQKDLPISVETGVIPPEFNKNNDTLLIQSSANPFYNMSIRKHFKKSYTGPFLLVKDIDKYSIENCRYVLYEDTEGKIKYTPNKGYSTSTQHATYYIHDRKTKENYVNPNIPMPKLMKAYISGLDKARKG